MHKTFGLKEVKKKKEKNCRNTQIQTDYPIQSRKSAQARRKLLHSG